MSKEITAYLQIMIGAVGIIVTVLVSPEMLNAVGQIGNPNSLPAEFSNASGVVKLAAVFFVLFCFALLLVLGLSVTISKLAKIMGANHPFLTSLFAVLCLVSLSITSTFAVLGINFWVAGFIASLSFGWLIFAAASDDEKLEGVGIVTMIGTLLFLSAGAVTILANATDHRRLPQPIEEKTEAN